MAYLLPRTVIVLFGWGMTCGLILELWPNVDPLVFYVTGVSWALAGIACFGYATRLRRAAEFERDSRRLSTSRR
jgi:hypothetical protein